MDYDIDRAERVAVWTAIKQHPLAFLILTAVAFGAGALIF